MISLADIAHVQTGALSRSRDAAQPDAVIYVRVAAIDESVILRDWAQAGAKPVKGWGAELREGDILVRTKSGRLVAAPVGPEQVGAYPTIDAFLVRPAPGVPPFFLVAVINAAGPIAATSAKPTVADVATLPVPDVPIERQRLIADLAAAVAQERRLLARYVALAEVAGRERIARALAAGADPPGTAQPEGGNLDGESSVRTKRSKRLIIIRRK